MKDVNKNILKIERVGSSLYKNNPKDIDYVFLIKEDFDLVTKHAITKQLERKHGKKVHIEYIITLNDKL